MEQTKQQSISSSLFLTFGLTLNTSQHLKYKGYKGECSQIMSEEANDQYFPTVVSLIFPVLWIRWLPQAARNGPRADLRSPPRSPGCPTFIDMLTEYSNDYIHGILARFCWIALVLFWTIVYIYIYKWIYLPRKVSIIATWLQLAGQGKEIFATGKNSWALYTAKRWKDIPKLGAIEGLDKGLESKLSTFTVIDRNLSCWLYSGTWWRDLHILHLWSGLAQRQNCQGRAAARPPRHRSHAHFPRGPGWCRVHTTCSSRASWTRPPGDAESEIPLKHDIDAQISQTSNV